jgi:L-lactate dehydrogenase complex protein LldG
MAMPDSKQSILNAIREQKLPKLSHPGLQKEKITYADPLEQFKTTLESVGGAWHEVNSESEIESQLHGVETYAQSHEVYASLPGFEKANIDLDAIADPHEVETIDFAILRGQFAVAENAAIWVTDAEIKHRVVYFIVQHLALVVPKTEIVNNMHDAYERLSFTRPEFGCFISGPSKTADIEQSLVIGAHGPRSLHVFLV